MKALWSLVLTIILSTTWASLATASLGDAESTVEADRQALHGTRKVENRSQNQATFRIHEITSDGVTVREFVSEDGTVFGVAWQGMGEPDLSQLFGSHYQ